jgi:Holin of 3TMs, for gene-transfer release
MAALIVGSLIEAGMRILDKVLPNPEAKAAAQLELLKLNQSSEFKQIETELAMSLAQTDINKAEASNPNLFVSGWRPAVGWVCVAALAAAYMGQPILSWLSGIYGWPPPPKMELGDLMYLLFGMLGIGTMRTLEKIKGVS